MAKCPNCRKEIAKPDRTLENSTFCIEAFTCNECGICFKESRWEVIPIAPSIFTKIKSE